MLVTENLHYEMTLNPAGPGLTGLKRYLWLTLTQTKNPDV